jgi:hypothetical protein
MEIEAGEEWEAGNKKVKNRKDRERIDSNKKGNSLAHDRRRS